MDYAVNIQNTDSFIINTSGLIILFALEEVFLKSAYESS